MDKKNESRFSPAVIPLCGIFAFFGTMFFLYQQSKYLPFLLGGVFFLLLGSVNLILFLFQNEQHQNIIKEDEDQASDRYEADESISNENGSSRSKKNIFKKFFGKLKIIPLLCQNFYNKYQIAIECIFLTIALIGYGIFFSMNAFKPMNAPKFEYWHLVVLVALFIVAIIIDKYCKHSNVSNSFTDALLKNSRAFYALIKLYTLVLSAAMTLSILNIFDIHRYVVYVFIALYYYITAMIIISLAIRVIKKQLSTNPAIVILLPFMAADAKELSVISFLEENTGITLRSLWSIKYIKKLLPVAIILTFLLFWVSTGVIYVESYQEGVVYRFGTMQEETLSPGLHLTLPYPIDKTEIYDTEKINKITIGYKSDENIDNVWTKDHGNSEYKLLLGSGDELVSLNLRVEYKIDDLKEYLKNTTNPSLILEATAYELTTSRTINTDLHTLLSINREAFAKDFGQELSDRIERSNTGIKVVSVIMESIHPPVEVAQVYQDFIGVGIDSERIILDAQAAAAVLAFEAESTKISILDQAAANHYSRLAEAHTDVAEFVAAIEAYNSAPEAYTYYKYLDAITTAYKNSNLVILGEGVDGSRIYWGSFTPIT